MAAGVKQPGSQNHGGKKSREQGAEDIYLFREPGAEKLLHSWKKNYEIKNCKKVP